MDIIDRYLAAVAAQLSPEEREDIIAELRDLILSRIEAAEAEHGRPLTDAEREAILKEIGHPLVVAARYRKGPDSLIGPELFPYWLYGVKAGLLILAALQALGLVIDLVGGSANFGQDIAQAFHGFFGSALTLIGALTLAGAVMEHYAIRPKWLTDWRPQDLGAFGLSDPAQWGVVGAATVGKATKPIKVGRVGAGTSAWGLKPPRGPGVGNWPGAEPLASLIFGGLFVAWWIGAINLPGLSGFTLRDGDVTITGAPVWTTLFGPILALALAGMAVDLFSLLRPQAVRIRAAAMLPLSAAGVWLAVTLFQAGHWFTLTQGTETARIVGGTGQLTLDTLRSLGDAGRDLQGMAATLSSVFSWVLAAVIVSLIVNAVGYLWRLLRG